MKKLGYMRIFFTKVEHLIWLSIYYSAFHMKLPDILNEDTLLLNLLRPGLEGEKERSWGSEVRRGGIIRRQWSERGIGNKCSRRQEEAFCMYAVSILHQRLWEPVTHEIWETAALSTIYSPVREKERDGESSHTTFTPGQSWHRFFTHREIAPKFSELTCRAGVYPWV